MELKWLEDLIALAESQSFSRAAQARNITQSGFSRRIQALEQWVGTDLVDRSAFPPGLTAAGRMFHEVACDVLQKLVDTRALIRSEERKHGSGLKIAAGHTIALSFLPGWLGSMSRHLGDLRARIVPTNVHDSVTMLVNGGCDLMFAYQHPGLPLHLDTKRYEILSVGREVLMPVSKPRASGGPLYRLPGTSRQPLPLISYLSSTYFGRCFALLLVQNKGRPWLQTRYESDMADVLKRMAVNGEGVAWLPRSLIAQELDSHALVPAGGVAWNVELGLGVYRDSLARDALTNRLWNLLRTLY